MYGGFNPDPLRYRPCVEMQHRILDERPCGICKQMFRPKAPMGKYCSPACSMKARRRADAKREEKKNRAKK